MSDDHQTQFKKAGRVRDRKAGRLRVKRVKKAGRVTVKAGPRVVKPRRIRRAKKMFFEQESESETNDDFLMGSEGSGIHRGSGGTGEGGRGGGGEEPKNPGNSFRRFVISCLNRRGELNPGRRPGEIEGGSEPSKPPKAAEKNHH